MKKETGYPSIDQTHKKGVGFFSNHPFIPNMSIFDTLKLLSTMYIKDEAIDCLDLTVTFEEMFANANDLSKSLVELGIKKKDIVTVVADNYYQAAVMFLAANKIGATVTYLNSQASLDEVKYYCNLFESPLLVNYNQLQEYNEQIKKDTKVKYIVTIKPGDLNTKKIITNDKILTGYTDYLTYDMFGNISKYAQNKKVSKANGQDDALILFTSGTTGKAKAVVLTNKNIVASGMYLKNTSRISNTRGEKSLVCVPFTYPYGFSTSMLKSLMCGRKAILAPGLSKHNISYFMEKKPNIIFGSPALLELIERNIPEEMDLSSVHTFISGGDFLSVPQTYAGIEFFKEHNANIEVCNGSGNAETDSCGTNSVGQPIRPETVGKVLYGTEAIIIDEETGKELKYGEEGILCVSGKHVFREYYNEPKLTEKSKFIYKGKEYFITGTRGILDKEGYFTLTGRDTRFYITGNLNKVYCDKTQNILDSIDVIDCCAVVKKPDDENLFTSKVYIVLKNGVEPNDDTIEYIKERCQGTIIMPETNEQVHLEPYEIPTSYEFISELPKTRADKVNYPALEELASKEYEKEKNSRQRLTKKQL